MDWKLLTWKTKAAPVQTNEATEEIKMNLFYSTLNTSQSVWSPHFRQPNVLAAPCGKTIKYLTCVTYSYTLHERENKKERKY